MNGAECTCGHPGLTYDGPHEDCPLHGLLALENDLQEPEGTDPDVRAATESYDRMVEKITGRDLPVRPPVRGWCDDCAANDHCAMCDCCCEPGTPS